MNHHKKKASLVPLISERDVPSNDVLDEAFFSQNTASDLSISTSPKLLTRRSGPKGDKTVYVVVTETCRDWFFSPLSHGQESGHSRELTPPEGQGHISPTELGTSFQFSGCTDYSDGRIISLSSAKISVDGVAASVVFTGESIFVKYQNTKLNSCFHIENEDIPYSEIISTEMRGLVKSKWLNVPFAENLYEMHVYTFSRAARRPSVWLPRRVIFSSPTEKLIETCNMSIQEKLKKFTGRPKRLLVMINPYGGRRRAASVYEKVVLPVFRSAGIVAQSMTTRFGGDAKEIIGSMSRLELQQLDGIVAVGGDGLFHEIVNAILEMRSSEEDIDRVARKIRVGHIPAGSTDAVACTLNGTRSAFTAAMHIVLGDAVPLDVLRIDSVEGNKEFAISMASYGFMGDLMEASEKMRWMGPVRYEFVGARMLAANRAYHAKIEYLPAPKDHPSVSSQVCRRNCLICSQPSHNRLNTDRKSFTSHSKGSLHRFPGEWKTVEGEFAGIMLVIMPCRSEKSSNGVAKYGHLSDGNIHLVMVKRCTRWQYLRFLMNLSSNGLESGSSNDYVDVVHAVAVKISHSSIKDKNSSWNIDGELLKTTGITAETHRGVIQVFSRGIEDESA